MGALMGWFAERGSLHLLPLQPPRAASQVPGVPGRPGGLLGPEVAS